jgi:hypothetical protein
LHLWGWPQLIDLLPFVQLKAAIQHCVSAAKSNSLKLIRLTAGLAALTPKGIPVQDCRVIQSGFSDVKFTMEIPNQTLALRMYAEMDRRQTRAITQSLVSPNLKFLERCSDPSRKFEKTHSFKREEILSDPTASLFIISLFPKEWKNKYQ